MMLRRKKLREDEGFNQVQREVLLAVKVSEEEIEAVATSPDLYDGLRLRIAGERRQRSGGKAIADDWRADRIGLNFIRALLGPSRPTHWILTAAAVLLLVAVALLLWLPKQSSESTQLAPVLPQTLPPLPHDTDPRVLPAGREEAISPVSPASNQQRRTYRHHLALDNRTDEIVTDFLPLTFTADSTAPESGQLVRVTIPRSALLAMGLPMNAERAGELVRADVFIGDDGLARAIRFIQ